MKKHHGWLGASLFTAATIVAAGVVSQAFGQSPNPPSTPEITAEQQKQLEQLKVIEEQLQRDREALHSAITEFGWDSEQADAAQERLSRDRSQYRKLRRSLRAAGVPVPPSVGAGPGAGRPLAGRSTGRTHHRGHRCHHCGDCPCCGE